MSDVVHIGRGMWPRTLAVHESGHAIAAWFLGFKEVSIALSDSNRQAKTCFGLVDDCNAVCARRKSFVSSIDEYEDYKRQDSRYLDQQWVMETASKEMIIDLAGVYAQSKCCDDTVEVLLTKGGKYDMQDFKNMVSIFQSAGGEAFTENELFKITMKRVKTLINLKWWDVIALTKILENRSHMPHTNFTTVMGWIDSFQPKILNLNDLDNAN